MAGVVRIHGGTTPSVVMVPAAGAEAAWAAPEDWIPGGSAGGGLPLRLRSERRPRAFPDALRLWHERPVTPTEAEEKRLYRRLWLEVDAREPATPPGEATPNARPPGAWLRREFALAPALGLDAPDLDLRDDEDIGNVRIEAVPNPEPGTWVLFVLGAAALGLARGRRRPG